MAAVWALDLPANEKLVLLAHADHANDEGIAYPSRRRIAWKTGYTEKSVQRITRRLRDAGLLELYGTANARTGELVRGARPSRGLVPCYRVCPGRGSKMDPLFPLKGGHPRQEGGRIASKKGVADGPPNHQGEPSVEPSLAFETFWDAYPARSGGNPKRPAWVRWRALTNGGGLSEEELVELGSKYGAYIRKSGQEHTRFVMQAQTFLGPNERWKDEWEQTSPWALAWSEILEAIEKHRPAIISGEAGRALYDLGGLSGIGKLRPRELEAARIRFLSMCAEEASK